MEKSDQERYLSNIIIISRMDGDLDPKEVEIIEDIRKEMGAAKTILDQALENAEIEDSITPLQRYSDNVRNLEDMLYVALIEGSLSEEKKKIIVNFADKINVTQEQISLLVQETKKRVRKFSESIRCPECGQSIIPDSKFCPECGSSLSDSHYEPKKKKLDIEIPDWGISIEFCESKSAAFNEALAEAELNPAFQESLSSENKRYCVTYPNDKMVELLKFIENLKGIRNKKVYVEGKNIQWDEVFGFLGCYQKREQASKPEEYCFGLDEKRLNIWGCKQSHMDWIDSADWFSYGKFKNESCFVFDKKRILHDLKISLSKIRFCPHFRGKFVEIVMSLFPDEVNVSEKELWIYKENFHPVPGAIKLVKQDEFYVKEIYTDGVRPVGNKIAKQIIQDAINKCGTKQLDFGNL